MPSLHPSPLHTVRELPGIYAMAGTCILLARSCWEHFSLPFLASFFVVTCLALSGLSASSLVPSFLTISYAGPPSGYAKIKFGMLQMRGTRKSRMTTRLMRMLRTHQTQRLAHRLRLRWSKTARSPCNFVVFVRETEVGKVRESTFGAGIRLCS